jgi:hypothetical protein
MMIRQILILSAAFAAAASVDALILNPSAVRTRRNTIRPLRALNDYDGRPSYRRQEGSKNRFNVRSTNYYNNNDDEDDAYAMARELASRRGLNLSSSPSRGYNNNNINGPPPPNIPMDSYPDYYTADHPPVYGSDYVGISAQELPMDYNSNNNNNFNQYSNDNYGNNGNRGGGGLRDISSSWGSKGQNGNNNYDAGRYELRIVKEPQRSSNGNRDGQWYKPQPPRQPPREVRQSDYRERRNDRLSMGRSQRSIGRAQSSMGRRTSYEQDRRLEYRYPPKGQSRSNSNSAFSLESNKVNKLQELASTSTRMDSLRFMPQYPAPNVQYRQNNIPYIIEPPPFRPPTTTPGFASTSEQMRRSGSSSTQQPFMSPPPQYSQIYQSSQQHRRPPPYMRPPSVSLSQLALQPHISPKDGKPSQQQQLQDMYQHDSRQWQQQQQPQQQQQQWRPPSYIEGQNQSAPSTPLSFQQMSQADFTRPFQGTGGSQQNQQQSNAFPNNDSNSGGARPPPDFNGGPPPFEQGGPPPPFGQGPPPPPFGGPDVHIFQNPFMNEPMFQESRVPAQSKSTGSNIKVPKDPNMESTRRRAAATNNPGSGMKIPKDPILERKRKQESKDQSDSGMKVPRDPFLERKKQKVDTSTASSKSSGNHEVRVPKEPNMKQKQQNERRPKEPKPKTTQNNTRVPREPTVNAQKDRIPKEPPRRNNGSSNVGKSNVVGKEEDLTYEDFASFFDMPKL